VIFAACVLLAAACASPYGVEVGAAPFDAAHADADDGDEGACDPRSADCDASTGCTAVIASDPKNCGRCGHDCLGGPCLEGKCQPSVLWTGVSPSISPFLTVDATHVYFTDTTKVIRCPKSGACGTGLTVADNQDNLRGIAVSSSSVYWASFGASAVRRCPKNVECGKGIDFMTGIALPYGLAVDAVDVFATSAASSGTVYRCPVGGCTSGTTALVAATDQAGTFIATDGLHVVWTGGTATQSGGSVTKCSTGGVCVPSPLAGGLRQPRGVVISNGFVYWTNSDSGGLEGSIMRCPVDGCGAGPTVLAGPHAGASSLAVDATDVYYAPADGRLMRVPIAGGVPSEITSSKLFWVAIDDVAIYATSDTGMVVKIAK
jgi:hypothetical protein